MSKVALYNVEGKQVGEFELNDTVFGIEPNEFVVHEAVVMQLASLRRGTVGVKNRAAVSGGGRKPFKQKGTGRARAGSTRSPLWRHGGVVFGPQARSYAYSIPRKKRRLALKSVLSDKLANGNLIVVDDLKMESPKTKEMVRILNNLGVERKALVVTGCIDARTSARNIEGVLPMTADGINVYDILNHDKMIVTQEAVRAIEEVLADA
ncbi:MAG TPA: 50S ribosomal protein L4 [Peptococcaceae bacterium]|nr:50S ribosomal protein L4 [Peptococcaceae bacterium]